ncbi:MAG TPA: ROK family protein [Acidimicrobiia bacterium]|nr:ROK family protein [Acidimicrobiia bacterium]
MSAEELRRHNLSAVLDRLHLSGPLTRSRLASQTGLNRSTIGDLIGELTRLGLVVEDPGTTSQGPGRPSSVARVVPSGAVVLAVDLEVDSLTIATVGLGGRVFEKVRVAHASGSRATPTQIVNRLAELTPPMVGSLPDRHNLVGMAVAVAGVVRRQDGFVHVSPNLGWTNVPLGGIISAELGIERVMMANEADLAALAEHRRANDGSLRHLIFVAGEVGIGIGIIYNGSPMLGAAGYAGEAGHVMVNPAGRQCRCGAVGCWETEVGEESLARLAGISPEIAHDGLVDEILRRAHAGDQQAFGALAEIGRWLGIGIGNLINVFNPEVVVIGGFFHPLYPFLEQAVNDAARSVALTAPWMSCSIRASSIGVDAALVGAAELALAAVIADPTIVGKALGRPENLDLVGRRVEGVGSS